MKKYLFLLLLIGCAKEYQPTELRNKDGFGTFVIVPDSIVSNYGDSVIVPVSAKLNACGVAPDAEAPDMGSEMYQIEGAASSYYWAGPQAIIKNLSAGFSKYVFHVWVHGYRSCDDSVMTDDAYDTLTLRVRADIKPTLTHSIVRKKHYLTWDCGPGEFVDVQIVKSLGTDTTHWFTTINDYLISSSGTTQLRVQRRDIPFYVWITCSLLPYRDEYISNKILIQ